MGRTGGVPPAAQLEHGEEVRPVWPSPYAAQGSMVPVSCGKDGEAETASVAQKHGARGAALPKTRGPNSSPSGFGAYCVHV